MAAIAERWLFDFLFLGDGLAANLRNHPYTCRLEPLTLLSALAMTTTHVGLAATMSNDLPRSLHGCAHVRIAGSHQNGEYRAPREAARKRQSTRVPV